MVQMILIYVLKHGIKASNTMNDAGEYSDEVPFFAGTHIFKADSQVIEKLSEHKKFIT